MPANIYLSFISFIACWLMVISPAFTFIGGICWGVALLMGGYLLSRSNLAILFGLNILLIYGLAQDGSLFFWLVFFGIPAFIMGILLNQQKGFYEILKWGMAAAIIMVSLFISLLYFNSTNVSNFRMQTEVDNYIQQTINLSEDSGFINFYEQQGIGREEIIQSMAAVARGMVMHLPAFYYLQAILAVYLILSMTAYISRKKKLTILARRPFREEIMPWQFAWVIIVALTLWLWGRDEMTSLYYVGSNLLVIATPITVYYGFSGLAFRWEKMSSRSRKYLLTLLIFVCIFITIPAIFFIGLLGLFDSLLDYRKLRYKKEEMK